MKERERVRVALWESLTEEQRTLVRDGEKLDDLYRCGLKLIQQPRYFCIGSDAVLLADFVRPRTGERILEAGCGNGALLMLLYVKCPQGRYVGVEVMENSADLAYRNLRLNGLEETLRVVRDDFRTWAPKNGPFDQIVCNPPYFPRGTCRVSKVPERAAARFEMNGTLAEFFTAAAAALTPEGCFSLVAPAARQREVLERRPPRGLFCQRRRSVLNLRRTPLCWIFGHLLRGWEQRRSFYRLFASAVLIWFANSIGLLPTTSFLRQIVADRTPFSEQRRKELFPA